MYETLTSEIILNRMLGNTQTYFPNSDTRVGSVAYTTEAPIAIELENVYIELDRFYNETFADTATRDYLELRCLERGIIPTPATNGIFKAVFNTSVPLSSRFRLGDYTYIVTEQISETQYKLKCETTGSEPNTILGLLTPIDIVNNLTYAELTECLIPGENEESTEDLRTRYFNSVSTNAFGGNVTDYIQKTKSLSGVGQVKVIPAWNGGGTVKVIFLDEDNNAPSSELVNSVQTAIDPITNHGEGLGIAPIGHRVTVVGATTTDINITFTLTYATGYDWNTVKEAVLSNLDYYFSSLSANWESETLIVRITSIEQNILATDGVIDISNTTINGSTTNIEIAEDSIPIRGTVNGI